jgi:hypothetical protein
LSDGPFTWITPSARPRVLAVLTLALVASSIWLLHLDRELVTPEATRGIVSFELAGHSARSESILRSWSERARSHAMLIQGFDSLYLLIYPAWLSLCASLLGTRLGSRWWRLGLATSWLVLGAAPLDALENYALIRQLMHGPSDLHAQLAWGCATGKFALVGVSILFLMAAGSVRLARWRGASVA